MAILQSDETGVPVFGSRVDGAIYQDRPAAYAVVKDADGRIAADGVNVREQLSFGVPPSGGIIRK